MRGLLAEERRVLGTNIYVEAPRELNERLVARGLLARVPCPAHGSLSDSCGCEFTYYDETPLGALAKRLDTAARFVGYR